MRWVHNFRWWCARKKAHRIKLLVMDVDGVLTTGALYYTTDGAVIKAFHVHDGMGITRWHAAGYASAMLTAGTALEAARARAEHLRIRHFRAAQDKCAELNLLAAEAGVGLDEIAYVGDDINDVACLRSCGLGFAVANARPEVKRAACLVTQTRGGEGAVREIIDWLLAMKKQT